MQSGQLCSSLPGTCTGASWAGSALADTHGTKVVGKLAVPMVQYGPGGEKKLIELQWEEFGVVRSFSGVATTEEIESSAALIQNDPRFPSVHYVVHDFSNCTAIQLDTRTRDKLIAQAAVATMWHPRFISAYVGDLPEVAELVSYIKATQVFDWPMEVHATLADARTFISLLESAPHGRGHPTQWRQQ